MLTENWTEPRSWDIERKRYANLRCFFLFVGYQSSGHLLLSNLLKLHPDVLMGLYPKTLERITQTEHKAEFFRSILLDMRANALKVTPSDPEKKTFEHKWLGLFRTARAIGDPFANQNANRIAKNPEWIDQIQERLELPIRTVRVVCNPFDNVAYLSKQTGVNLEAAAVRYATAVQNTQKVLDQFEEREVIHIDYDKLGSYPVETITKLCRHLSLDTDEEHLAFCQQKLKNLPQKARKNVEWDRNSYNRVMAAIRQDDSLRGYRF